MRSLILAALLAIAPALAWGQSVHSDGGIDMSAHDPDVSGAMSGSIDGRYHDPVARANGNDDEAPLDVQRYIQSYIEQHNLSGDIGAVSQGGTVPNGTPIHRVPGYPQWGFALAGGQRVIVNRQTGEVVGTVR